MFRLKVQFKKCLGLSVFATSAMSSVAMAQSQDVSQLDLGREAIRAMAGCYLVDYSYTETESLKPDYTRDNRVYDVNLKQSIKEWIYAEDISPNRIRLQHILFAADLNGTVSEYSKLKHTGEDWEYNAGFLYDFVAPLKWQVKDLRSSPGLWTRRITNLDDGLRYQCAASWSSDRAYPQWSCDNYSPIPGREFRDMGRKDYQTLHRSTQITVYGESWLERQVNVKTIHQDETRTPLAKELGKNWYVRLPDSECEPAREFAQARKPFWTLVREAWDTVYTGDRAFVEKSLSGQPSRYFKIMGLEQEYLQKDLNSPTIREEAKKAILRVIEEYRAN